MEISSICPFAMVKFLFAQGGSNSVLDLFFSSSEAMKGEKLDYFKFLIGTHIVPFMVTTLFVYVLQLFSRKFAIFFITSLISGIFSALITIYSTIATSGYFNKKLEDYKY